MKKIVILGCALAAIAALSGCVVQPSPYYGGPAPYYGTAYQPGYAYGELGVGYYPYYRSHNIYSNYHNDYWHHQRGFAGHGGFGGGAHGGGGHGGGGNGGRH